MCRMRETERNSCGMGIIAGIGNCPSRRFSATAFRSYGRATQSHHRRGTGHAERPRRRSVIGHTGHGGISRMSRSSQQRTPGGGDGQQPHDIHRPETGKIQDNYCQIYTDSSRINRTTTLSLKSDTISLGLEFCETVAQSFKSVIRIENSDLLRLGGSHFSVKLVFKDLLSRRVTVCRSPYSRDLVSRDLAL